MRAEVVESSPTALKKPLSNLKGNSVGILILQHFSNAPRAQKEAAALSSVGVKVTVLGSWWDSLLAEEDKAIAERIGVNFCPVFSKLSGKLTSFVPRLRARVAREAFARWGIIRPEVYGITARALLREARRLRADLYMVHCEPGLWVGCRLLDEGFKVGVDFEDWFSEDLLLEDRIHRPVAELAKAEKRMLKEADPCFATTRAMADRLAEWANVSPPPVVIPNSFPITVIPKESGRMDQRNKDVVSFYWFSQTIGPGRGLESLAKALPTLRGKWELHLRGNLRSYDRWFEQHFPSAIRPNVRLHACVSNQDLPHHSASHDVGLALEVPHCPSRDLTATNKIFEYLRCGLAVIASSTQGQVEVMEKCPQAGLLVPPDDANGLAKAMQWFLDNSDRVAVAKQQARKASEACWAWESSEPQLLHALQLALHRP